ncbi:MAG: trehalase family glycosidase [Nanoarchaeota archaeon]
MNTYNHCLKHIENIIPKLIFYLPEDKETHIGLPNPFVAPAQKESIFENDQFYWDSYFIIIGLTEMGETNLAREMTENLAYLCQRFGIIPLRNRYYNLGISQPPFFTSMALEVYEQTKNLPWLAEMAKIAERELLYWMDKKQIHMVYKGLSRYCDHWHTHVTTEHESGWDMTSRFFEKCLDFLPIDLNSLLYKYEKDLSFIYSLLEDNEKSDKYSKAAKERAKTVNQIMYTDGFFFDYDFKNKKTSEFYSLAGFYPLWAGLATQEQAELVKKKLPIFECRGGLANTQSSGLSEEFKQWDYPNGWPNQQWIVIKGLLNYGFREDAKRLAYKWLELNRKVYEKTGEFWEKYDVVNLTKGRDGRYPTQKGFGWTDSVFYKLVNSFN